jgi:hypothetical protein
VLARSQATVDTALAALAGAPAGSLGLTADVTDEWALRTALEEAVARFGAPEVLVYNAALIRSDAVGELSAAEHLDAWAVNVVGAITAIGWRPDRPSIPTRSPASTGGSTRSPRARGSARCSTPAASRRRRGQVRTPRAERPGDIAAHPERRRHHEVLGAGRCEEAECLSAQPLARGLLVSRHQRADRLCAHLRAGALLAGQLSDGAAELLRLGQPDQEMTS